jgi:hypothetical protein
MLATAEERSTKARRYRQSERVDTTRHVLGGSKPRTLGLLPLRPQRSRHKPPTSVPYVQTNDVDFDSQLILDPKQASASVSPVPISDMSDAGEFVARFLSPFPDPHRSPRFQPLQ